jgi:hypothetical protein
MKNLDIISSLQQENKETQEEKVNKNISNKIIININIYIIERKR